MDKIYDDPNDINKPLLRRVRSKFFKNRPVKIGLKIEGQAIEDGMYVLGCYAGPETHVGNLLHEMAHLAEREPNKLLEYPNYAWGFGFGKYWEICGRSGWEPNTDQSVRREARVFAYQWNIMQSLGLDNFEDKSVRQLVASSIYLNAFYLYANRVVGKGYEQGIKQKENQALDILAEEVEELAATKFTLNDFIANWNERMELLSTQ